MRNSVRQHLRRPRRPRALLAVTAAALALLAPASSAVAAEKGVVPEMTWGVSSQTQSQDATAIGDLGAKWVRLNISWSNWTEPSPGSYSSSALSSFDKAISLSAQAGAKVIIMVNESPSWARDSSNPNAPPRNVADYAKFVSMLAARWKGQVAGYEVWNEPNLGGFYMPPSTYASLLSSASAAIRGADPNAKVLFAGLAYNDYGYLDAAYGAIPGLAGAFDVQGAHPYSRNGASPDIYWRDANGRVSADSFSGYRELRAINLAHGADKPIWITEIGWSTETGDSRGVSAQQQADYLTLAYKCLEQDPYVQVATWYNLRNNWWANDANDWEDQLGLMTTNFSPKPAYAAFKAYTPGSGGCNYHEAPAPVPAPSAAPLLPGPLGPSGATPSPTPRTQTSAISLTLRVRAAKAAARRARAAARGRVVSVNGRVSGRTFGQVTLTFAYRSGGRYRTALRKTLRLGRTGTFSGLVPVPRAGRWRVRAAFGSGKASTSSLSRYAYVTV